MPRIRMNGTGPGVVGEDRTDWLPGTEHECSDHFARHLERRGLARITDAPLAVTPGITNADPVIEYRDPEGLDTIADAPIVRPPSRRTR